MALDEKQIAAIVSEVLERLESGGPPAAGGGASRGRGAPLGVHADLDGAVAAARAEGIAAHGPFAPDTVFMRARNAPGHPGEFDLVVAMTHDHGLIPLKLVHFDDGVNVTMGLPILRTSVDHGTAYDIAGKGTANPASLLAAVRMAASMAGKAS